MESELTDNLGLTQDSSQNSEFKPLEDLNITIANSGIQEIISALSKQWIEERYFLQYEAPVFYAEDGTEIIGAKEHWIELVTYINNDLIWLLGLPHNKFWSNIAYNPSIIISLEIILQEAPPFYDLESLPTDQEVRELLSQLLRNVLVIFARLITNKESPAEYMKQTFQGNLLYDKCIFTIPILFDLCQQFGRENKKTVAKILSCVFILQPLYIDDLKKSVSFLLQIFRNIEQRFEDSPIPLAGEVMELSERGGAKLEISLPALEDVITYLLDTVSTLSIFLDIYSSGICFFHTETFLNKVVSIYENTIPEMYKRLEDIAFKDDTLHKFNKLKHFLDVTRIELLKLYRTIIYKDIEDVLEAGILLPETEIKNHVETFIELLSNALAEENFIIDYYRLYPVDVDMDILSHVCPEVDTMKCEYILNSIYASLEKSNVENVASVINDKNEDELYAEKDSNSVNKEDEVKDVSEEKLVALMAEVKDILCELGEGFIVKCLEYYNYNSESVINAVLEDSLPPDLKKIDTTMPYIPEDKEITVSKVTKNVRKLSVTENDIDEICHNVTKDVMAFARKRENEYQNLNQMLNDKSHVKEVGDIYNRYTLVADEYEDEYDDTYDSHDIGLTTQDDAVELDRPFTTPRVLLRNDESCLVEYEEEPEENADEAKNKDNFVEDPAVLRARAEQRRLSKRGTRREAPLCEKDVTGKPKGQGQDKNVSNNRDFKNTKKSSYANHNRRAGSSWKRRQGMIPS